MKKIPGTDLWVPDSDAHFYEQGPAAADYQWQRAEAAIERGGYHACAVDAGAHVGLITRRLAHRFDLVHAFEPHPDNFACLVANTEHLPNVVRHNKALGRAPGEAGIRMRGGNSGDTQLLPGDPGGVEVTPLDALPLDWLDLLKIDVQGYEGELLAGAYNTLAAFAPTVLLESEAPGALGVRYGSEGEAQTTLTALGATAVKKMGVDTVWAFGPDGALPYDKYARRGDYHWRRYEQGKNKDVVDWVVGYVRRQGHASLLELGCGDGLFAGLFGQGGLEVVGLDNNKTAVGLAQKRGVAARHLSLYRARDLHRGFDAVCLFDVFEHLHKQDLALRVCAALAPTLYLLNPEPKGAACHANELTADGLAEFVTARGWRVVHRERFPSPRPDRFSEKCLFHLERPSS